MAILSAKAAPVKLLGASLILLIVLSGAEPRQVQATGPGGNGASFLLLHDWYGESPCPTPTFLRQNKMLLESLPFDGIAVYMRNPDGSENPTMDLMVNKEVGYSMIARVLTPLKGLQFTNLTQNFAAVFSGRPPDFFNDWSIIIRNFADLARAAHEVGLKGVYFDNENYFSPWSHYPLGVEYPTLNLRAYQEQARLRGRQVMEAMVAQFPEIVVISLHGPYISEPKAPAPLFPQWSSTNQLMGPFFCGFMEGAGKRATCVDGGRLYHLRSPKDFLESYNWRKSGISQDKVGSDFIPPPLRAAWPFKINIAFGIYDKPFGQVDMDPELLRPTLANALRQSDRYTWLHVERLSFLRPSKNGGAGEAWLNAVRQARADTGQKVSRH
ncbi:MAG TPA: hypothetical protein VMU54_01525 [Planctomycetota bacterium]|nr:hypothetical protein [Planctomycetota bacterium]